MEVVAILIAGLSLLVSVVVAVRQDRLQTRLATIEEDRRSEEVRRQQVANVVAVMERDQDARGRPRRRLVLRNEGEAAARQVSFDVQGVGGRVPRMVIDEGVLPIPALGPGAEYPFVVSASVGVAPALDVTIRWVDGEGEHEEMIRVSVY